MSKRTTEQTRHLLLDVATEMLFERGVDVGVSHIKLADVVAAAGLTTGAAYRCWENQQEFHRDLAAAAIRYRDRSPTANTVARITALVKARAPLTEIIRVGGEANLHRYPDDVAFLTTIGLRACGPLDPRLAEASRDRLEAAVDNFATMYDALAHVYRRRVRPPFTMQHVALVFAALSEGFALQAMSDVPHPHVERGNVGEGVGDDWTLMACAAQAVVEWFTEPDPDPLPTPATTESERAETRASN